MNDEAQPIAIRAARTTEQVVLESLQRLASLANPSDRAALLANPDAISLSLSEIHAGHVYVAEQESDVVSFAAVLPRSDGDVELDGLFVEPCIWRTGVGRALVQRCAEHARVHGAAALHVVGNPHALGFYCACGFEIIGACETRFGPGLLMRRQLSMTKPARIQFSTARCQCGDVAFGFTGPANWCGHCHCASCRRATSSPFTTWIGVTKSAFCWTRKRPRLFESPPGTTRFSCPRCGTPMAYQHDDNPSEIHLYGAIRRHHRPSRGRQRSDPDLGSERRSGASGSSEWRPRAWGSHFCSGMAIPTGVEPVLPD